MFLYMLQIMMMSSKVTERYNNVVNSFHNIDMKELDISIHG